MTPRMTPEKMTILRDAGTFAVKLWLDGIKDFVFAFVGLGAAAYDLVRGRSERGYLFYRVMRIGARVDAALDVFSEQSPPEPTTIQERT